MYMSDITIHLFKLNLGGYIIYVYVYEFGHKFIFFTYVKE